MELGNYAIVAAPIAGARLIISPIVGVQFLASFGTLHFSKIVRPTVGYVTKFGVIDFSRHHTLAELFGMVTPNVSLAETPRVFNLAYGDGYYSDMSDGLQALTRTLTLSWDGIQETEIQMLVDYFYATSGTAISFAPPREKTPRKWITQQIKRTKPYPTAGVLTATFIEKVP